MLRRITARTTTPKRDGESHVSAIRECEAEHDAGQTNEQGAGAIGEGPVQEEKAESNEGCCPDPSEGKQRVARFPQRRRSSRRSLRRTVHGAAKRAAQRAKYKGWRGSQSQPIARRERFGHRERKRCAIA